jgi:hypothetical protein
MTLQTTSATKSVGQRSLADHIQFDQPDQAAVRRRLSKIRESILGKSRYVNRPNFTQIESIDLLRIFDAYDQRFLDETCRSTLKRLQAPLSFRLSSKMTRAGGKTVRHESFDRSGRVTAQRFEIVISTTLLFGTFRGKDRHIRVAGLICENRLDALMRVMEHELVHLAEMLVWRDSSCSARRFREISHRLFDHRESNHQLITPLERAMKDLGIRPGDMVQFAFEGRRMQGKVNRITRRATVLVPSKTGELYTDGNRYQKFYVPLARLSRC